MHNMFYTQESFACHVNFNIRAQPLYAVKLPGVHITFYKTYYAYFHVMACGPQRYTQCCCGFAFTVACNNNHKTGLMLRLKNFHSTITFQIPPRPPFLKGGN